LKICSGNLEPSQIRTLLAIAVERCSVTGYSKVPWLGQGVIDAWPKSGMWKGVHSIIVFLFVSLLLVIQSSPWHLSL